MFIFRIMHAVPYSNQPIVKDVIACLHSYFTCNLLIALSILLSYKQFGGRPIECMTPLGFSSAWNQYAENYCFSSDTYYVSFDEQIEDFTHDQRESKHISYYQWMPFFLLFQCACFKIPTLFWKYFASESGVKVGEVLRLATNESNSDFRSRADNINSLCVHLQGALRFHDRLKKRKLTPHKILLFLNIKYSSHYVTFIYFLCKFLFLLNVICQTMILNRYLFAERSGSFGFEVWKNLLYGNTSWKQSGLFPRVTLCDFEVREMGQTQNHTIQCVLLLNIFTEKVFLILWAWYVVLTAVTVLNFSSWTLSFFNPRSAEHFIFNHLEMSGQNVFSNHSSKGLEELQDQVSRFICKYLKHDGILILRLIAQHADVVFITDLVYKLWESHYSIEKQRESLRRTEHKWQEHLRRFDIIEGRDKRINSIDSNLYASYSSPFKNLFEESPLIRARRKSSTLKETPIQKSFKKLSSVQMRRTSFSKNQLGRSLSAESLPDESVKFADSSDDNQSSSKSRKSSMSRHPPII